MSKISNFSSYFYETPNDTVLQHRTAFYSIKKENTEPAADWFGRIRSVIEQCDFGNMDNFLIIDKFFCGLDNDTKRLLQKTKVWSVEQLYQTITHPNFTIETKDCGDAGTHQFEVAEFLKIEFQDVVSSTIRLCLYLNSHFSIDIAFRRELHQYPIAVPATMITIIGTTTVMKIDLYPIL